MLTTSPLIIRFPRTSILVARRIAPSNRIRDLHRTELRRIGGVRQGEAIDTYGSRDSDNINMHIMVMPDRTCDSEL